MRLYSEFSVTDLIRFLELSNTTRVLYELNALTRIDIWLVLL